MNPTTARILFSLFLIAHGYIHMSLAQVPVPQPGALRTPFMPAWWRDAVDPAWTISRLGVPPRLAQTIGWVLWLLVVAGYTAAGAVLLFAPAQVSLWQGSAVAASILSLVLLILYWHPWLPAGIFIDFALLAAISFHWQPIQLAN